MEAHPALASPNIVNISSLSPEHGPLPSQSIRAIVTLTWPYSSSYKSTAILLAERDFRLRRNKGQIRIQLHGAAAVAFVGAAVSIGDEVQLSLDGARWVRDADPVKTPGRCVDGELLFAHKFSLRVLKEDGTVAETIVDEPEPAQQAEPLEVRIHQLETAALDYNRTPKQPHRLDEWSSPAFLRATSMTTNPFLGWEYDPFADEDESIVESPRKRTKFSRPSSEWRYVEEDSVSTEETPDSNKTPEIPATPDSDKTPQVSETPDVAQTPVVEPAGEATPTQLETASVSMAESSAFPQSEKMKPPTLPRLSTAMDSDSSVLPETNVRTPPSPRLQPVQSPGLPLPSPFPSRRQSLLLSSQLSLRTTKGGSQHSFLGETGDASMQERIAEEEDMTAGATFSQSTVPTQPVDKGNANEQEAVAETQNFEDTAESHDAGQLSADTTSAQHAPEKRVEVIDLLSDSETEAEKIRQTTSVNSQTQESPTDTLAQVIHSSTIMSESFHSSARGDFQDMLDATLQQRSPQDFDEPLMASENVQRQGYTQQEPVLPPISTAAEQITSPASASKHVDFDEFLTLSPVQADPPPPQIDSTGGLQHTMPPQPLEEEEQPPSSHEERPLQPTGPQEMTSEASQQRLDIEVPEETAQTVPAGHPPLTPLPSDLQNMQKVGPLDGTTEAKAPSARTRRQSARLRNEQIPEGISQWFTARRKSRRSSAVIDDTENRQALTEPNPAVLLQPSTSEETAQVQAPRGQTQMDDELEKDDRAVAIELPGIGFRTRLSYYTPLSALRELLNHSSSQTGNPIDVMAVVTGITQPKRAKYGPKDHYVVLHLSEPSLTPKETLVEAFRPWKRSLPAASIGDVALMRNFLVKSRKNSCYLLSGDQSAWLIWRYPDANPSGEPIWAKQAGTETIDQVKEECKGPPVEIGEEERKQAEALRRWWLGKKQEEATAAKGHRRTRSMGSPGPATGLGRGNATATKL